jgi:hypothetical protein
MVRWFQREDIGHLIGYSSFATSVASLLACCFLRPTPPSTSKYDTNLTNKPDQQT